MEESVALLRTNQIKKRLLGVTALLELLQVQRDPLANDVDYLTTLLPDVVPCLRENNFKVAMTSLEILEILVQRVPENATRAHFKTIWSGLVDCLGDSKLQVRLKAVDVVVQLAQILGVAAMFDRLRPCIAHKNWRTREQTVHALWRCLEQLRLFNASVKNDVLDDVVRLLEDSAKEVRDAAMQALEKFYEYVGPSLMYDLENKKIRSGHMKTLTDKFSGAAATQRPNEPLSSSSAYAYGITATATAPPSRSTYDATSMPMSSTARFLSAIKNKEYDFDNLSSTVEALSRPTPSLEKSPSQTSTGSNKSQSASVGDAFAAGADDALSRPVVSGISDKDIQREMNKIAEGLRLSNDWSVRVESLKNLQRLTHKCNHSGSCAALAQGIRSMREVLNEQIVDLRSSVAREACQTLQTLAKVLKDDFNPNAEYFIGNLMKATYVTILVISTASDTSIRGIIESTKNGYTRLINKFIDGAKTRNQVLRLNSVIYLTLTLERWNVVFLSKHLDLFLQILPPLLHDALGEVRAQARKCFWALHRLFSQEADGLFERMDPSTQKNLRDDVAAREKPPGDNQGVAVPPAATTFSSNGRFLLRKDSARALAESATESASVSSAAAPSSVAVYEDGAASASSFGAASKVPLAPPPSSSGPNSSSGAVGPRRVLGGSSQLVENGEQQRSFPSASRVLGQGGAMRVGFSARSTSYEEDPTAQASSKSTAGPLRVLKTVDRPDASNGSNQSLPPVPRAQRVQIATEGNTATANETSQSSSGGPVARKDRQNGPKRRALTPEAEMASSVDELVSSSNSRSDDAPPMMKGAATAVSRDPPAPPSKPTRAPPAPIFSQVEEGFDEALSRIENGLWSVRLEAVELIDRTLEKSNDLTASTSSTAKEKKMDERVLLALIRHLADAHYRVAQAALKALQSCLRVIQQPQVAPFMKTLLPRLFQKLVDPKESTRAVAREILEFLVSNYDAGLLIGYVIQQLTDGGNMKMKAAVCHYVKQLLPGSRDYIQQSANNAHMRGLLTKLAQLLDGDSPVSVSTACSDVLQVVCSLYPNEVESAMPLLAPSKRSTLARVLRARGIVLSLTQVPQTASSSSASQPIPDNQRPPPPPADDQPEKEMVGRKRHALSPSKFAASPPVTSRKEKEALRAAATVTTADDVNKTARVLDYEKLSSLSEFASMLSSVSPPASPGKQFEDLLSTISANNGSETDKLAALQKLASYIANGSESFWEKHFPRVFSVLLECAAERDAAAIRVLRRVLRVQARRTEEFFHPILIGLLDTINGQNDMADHLVELTLTEMVSSSAKRDRVLDLLMPLLENQGPPVLQAVLKLVRTVLERMADEGKTSAEPVILLRSAEWNSRLLASLVAKLQHASSDVRKKTVDCLVAYHFATNEDSQLSKYLEQHVDSSKYKLVDIMIQRKKATRA